MKKLMPLFCVLFTIFSSAKDITRIVTIGDHYKISITRGGNPIGAIEIELYPDVAPKHCHNFDSLVAIQFYDGTAFHRVIPNFMIQGGDPNSVNGPKSTWGYGDPSQTKVPAEFNNMKHVRGIMSAARAQDINSATSQFFICVVAYPSLDGKYSIYGHVVSGMNVVDSIVNSPRDAKDNPIEKVEMTIVKIPTSAVKDNLISIETDIRIAPNPSKDMISLISKHDLQINQWVISDIDGSLIKQDNHITNLKDLNIPISDISTGIYFLKLISNEDNSVRVLKFVVNE
ncbi:MAG: peptidylprolyl isomerase [Candidatus Kapabacteria bacterium]|nr:peptidylprolyl isomerase [Candidatus Kapabacteria bacterium]